ncbi:LysR family transcriptional regulator [Bradyrhizobium stylosanthis]|nr:LysR family transcriptional regulator [Bradyrhizobium stylosanthis]
MPHLNYHHLRYFWIIATEGSMSRAAERLNVSPSSLSVQLKALEAQLGQQLFERVGRTLQLTEAGRIALDYAGSVFKSGHELIETLSGLRPGRQLLRVGAAATLSRNFQIAFLRPLIGRGDVELIIHTGLFGDLLEALDGHKLDVVLANHPAPPDARSSFENTLIDEQRVSIVGHKPPRPARLRFPQDLAHMPIVLPGRGNALRSAFDALLGRSGVKPVVAAEVDDMAMLRLMARESGHLALVPSIVVIDELRSGLLVERTRLSELAEQFYAVSQQRRYPNPLVAELLENRNLAVVSRRRRSDAAKR